MLDGACDVEKLVQRVKELGMPAVAMTDHGNIFGAALCEHSQRPASSRSWAANSTYVRRKTTISSARPRTGHLQPPAGARGERRRLPQSDANYLKLRCMASITSRELARDFFGAFQRTDWAFRLPEGRSRGTLMEGNYEAARASGASLSRHLRRENFFLEIQDQGLEMEHRIHPSPVPTRKISACRSSPPMTAITSARRTPRHRT